MHKNFIKIAAILGALTVLLGAFGAHTLKEIISEKSLAIFETGVRYQFYHLVALLIIGMIYKEYSNRRLIWAGRCFLIGILLFSGSLYLLAIAGPSYSIIGIITPFGGGLFILGWIFLFSGVVKNDHSSNL